MEGMAPDAVDGAPELITALLGRHSIFNLRPTSEEHMRHFARIGVDLANPVPKIERGFRLRRRRPVCPRRRPRAGPRSP